MEGIDVQCALMLERMWPAKNEKHHDLIQWSPKTYVRCIFNPPCYRGEEPSIENMPMEVNAEIVKIFRVYQENNPHNRVYVMMEHEITMDMAESGFFDEKTSPTRIIYNECDSAHVPCWDCRVVGYVENLVVNATGGINAIIRPRAGCEEYIFGFKMSASHICAGRFTLYATEQPCYQLVEVSCVEDPARTLSEPSMIAGCAGFGYKAGDVVKAGFLVDNKKTRNE